MKKKLLVGVLVLSLLTMQVGAVAEYFVNDGYVKINGGHISIKEGSIVTVTAVKKYADWMESDTWDDDIADNIQYYGTLTAGKDGAYSMMFAPTSNGAYDVYFGADSASEPVVHNIVYINETDSNTALTSLFGAVNATDVENALTTYKSGLGLFDKIYSDNTDRLSAVSAIVFNEINGKPQMSAVDTIKLIYSALLMNEFNNSSVTSDDLSGEYSEYLYLEDLNLSDIYKTGYNASLIADLSGKNFTTLKSFEDATVKAMLMAAVKMNDGLGAVEKALAANVSFLGISSSIVDENLASAVVNNAPADYAALKTFVSTYTPPTTGGGTGGGGGAGGGGGTITTGGLASGSEIAQTPVVKPQENMNYFDDIDSVPWAAEAINSLFKLGIINGKSESEFDPSGDVTREEFIKMIMLAFKINLVDDVELPFKDVTKDDWSYSYVKSAYLAGVTEGLSEDTFGKGTKITRQDACTILYRAFKVSKYNLNSDISVDFKDDNKIADYAAEAVRSLSASGIINGDENKNFNPANFASRAESAKIIYAAVNVVSNQ